MEDRKNINRHPNYVIPIQNFIRTVSINVMHLAKAGEKCVKRIDFNKYSDKLAQRPWLATALIICSCITVVSVVTFVILLASVAAVAITGVVLIEGTIVTIGTIIFCGCLVSIWILVAVFAIVGTCFYYGTLYFHNHMHNKDLMMQKTSTKNVQEMNTQAAQINDEQVVSTSSDDVNSTKKLD